MSMTTFWVVSSITLLVATVCMIVNNWQFQTLKELLVFLQETVKKSLITNGESNKARMVSLEDIPKIQEWYNECQNYGLINICGMVSAIALLVSGGFYHVLSYIIVLPSGMFLASNIFFLPRAFDRLNKAISINNNYVLLLAAFDKAQEIKSDDTGSTSSP